MNIFKVKKLPQLEFLSSSNSIISYAPSTFTGKLNTTISIICKFNNNINIPSNISLTKPANINIIAVTLGNDSNEMKVLLSPIVTSTSTANETFNLTIPAGAINHLSYPTSKNASLIIPVSYDLRTTFSIGVTPGVDTNLSYFDIDFSRASALTAQVMPDLLTITPGALTSPLKIYTAATIDTITSFSLLSPNKYRTFFIRNPISNKTAKSTITITANSFALGISTNNPVGIAHTTVIDGRLPNAYIDITDNSTTRTLKVYASVSNLVNSTLALADYTVDSSKIFYSVVPSGLSVTMATADAKIVTLNYTNSARGTIYTTISPGAVKLNNFPYSSNTNIIINTLSYERAPEFNLLTGFSNTITNKHTFVFAHIPIDGFNGTAITTNTHGIAYAIKQSGVANIGVARHVFTYTNIISVNNQVYNSGNVNNKIYAIDTISTLSYPKGTIVMDITKNVMVYSNCTFAGNSNDYTYSYEFNKVPDFNVSIESITSTLGFGKYIYRIVPDSSFIGTKTFRSSSDCAVIATSGVLSTWNAATDNIINQTVTIDTSSVASGGFTVSARQNGIKYVESNYTSGGNTNNISEIISFDRRSNFNITYVSSSWRNFSVTSPTKANIYEFKLVILLDENWKNYSAITYDNTKTSANFDSFTSLRLSSSYNHLTLTSASNTIIGPDNLVTLVWNLNCNTNSYIPHGHGNATITLNSGCLKDSFGNYNSNSVSSGKIRFYNSTLAFKLDPGGSGCGRRNVTGTNIRRIVMEPNDVGSGSGTKPVFVNPAGPFSLDPSKEIKIIAKLGTTLQTITQTSGHNLRIVSGDSTMYSSIYLEFDHPLTFAGPYGGKCDVYIPAGSIYLTEFPEVKSGIWFDSDCICTSS